MIPSVKKTLYIVDAKPRGYTLEELYDLNVARASYTERWNEVFVNNKLDVLLAPGAENTAVPHDTYGNAPYTGVWNLLNVSLQAYIKYSPEFRANINKTFIVSWSNDSILEGGQICRQR